jgi:tetratricopeptide (TPR) repeat protein
VAHDFEKSLSAANRALEIMDQWRGALYYKGVAELFLNRTTEAVSALSAAVANSGRHSIPVAGLAVALNAAGRRLEAEELAIELRQREHGVDSSASVALAEVEVALGNADHALAALERAFAHRRPELVGAAADPLLDQLRETEEFRDLIGRVWPNRVVKR